MQKGLQKKKKYTIMDSDFGYSTAFQGGRGRRPQRVMNIA